MTSSKSFKSRVRTRMAKTGESYAAARRNLVPAGEPADSRPVPVPGTPAAGERAAVPEERGAAAPVPGEPPVAARGAMLPDDVVVARTGRSHDEWFALLDGWGATARPHGEIARWLVEEHGVGGWWAQSVTVSYERARGLRAAGQSRGGDFSVGASKTVDAPAERVIEAFTDEDLRARWLPDAPLEIRTSRPGRSVTANWEGRAAVTVGVVVKGERKTQLGIQHGKIPDAAAAAELKAYWRERVTVLKKLLES
ncbi:DUF4287 domain-containing protein [Planomonospora venezuelensis]|uniref:DUF4287 domain-containing protein n=1 Tax=Planomonospora venezuelensis TaxID=1999 RepID=A0A841CW54_PLAVE|nr:DUF4287 domain-containing protein [Planomonospora venezuelensis]MBB5961063.1 hypothetical protein [Planomonospora venezuelensis]GIN04769.1 hypothetical protein Pve01_64270 [Planomonospora venezuelensis]